MSRSLLPVRFAAVSLAAIGFAAMPRCALAAESPDSTASPQDRAYYVDSLPAGGASEPRRPAEPARSITTSSDRRKSPVFVDFLIGWHRPESQHGELILKSRDYGALGFRIGGYPRPWLEIMGDLDFRWASLEGPPLAADPGTTLGTERSLSTSFAGITGRFKHAGPIGSPYAELCVGFSNSTISVSGTQYAGIWPIILPVPFTESVHEGAPIARVGLGVTFPRKKGVEFGVGAKYYSLAQNFGRLGQARVGGLTCDVMIRSDPWSWFDRYLGGRRKK